jgi:hypothetical protein
MFALGKVLQSLRGVADVVVVVGQIRSRTNHSDLKPIYTDSFSDPGIQDRRFVSRVAPNQDEEISLINTGDS